MKNMISKDITQNVKRRVEIMEEVNYSFTLSGKELEEYQNEKMRKMLVHVFQNNEFYRNKLIKSRFTLEQLSNLTDFSTLPFTYKEEIKEQYPYGLLSTSQAEVFRYGESTGTTGEPINSYYTCDDWFANNCIVATFLAQIISKEDTAAVIVPYGLALVGQDMDRALELIGAKTIAIDILSSACPVDRALKILRDTETTVLVCSPSRALYMAEEIKKLGYDPKKDFRVKKVLCVGEGTSVEKAKAILHVWGAKAYPLYGMTETNTLAMSCDCGKLHLVENKIRYEIFSPETNEVVKDGERGELVVTSFGMAMPLIRYRTGDLCTIHSEKCECGNEYRYLEHHGRISDSLVINNQRIQILDLEALILSISGTTFYSLKHKDDKLKIGLVLNEEECRSIESKLAEVLFNKYGITATVYPIEGDEIMEKIKSKVKPSISTILQEE